MTEALGEEVFVVTSSGSGHLFPCMELCKHLSSINYKTTLVLPSNLSSSLPSSFLLHHPLLSVAQIAPSSGGPPMSSSHLDLEAHLSSRFTGTESPRPVFSIIDFQMGWTKQVFWKFSIPVISFFTFSACAAAMEWGAWKSNAGKINAGEVLTIPGLPEEMCVTFVDVKRRQGGPPHIVGHGPPDSSPVKPRDAKGPPKPGDKPPWVPLIEGTIGLMFNTCDELERPFLSYVAKEMSIPVWGVGPLLPEQYWQSSDSLIRNQQIRLPKHDSNYSEDEVIRWLNSKPRGSVLYVAFGSEVGPTMDEYQQLAGALEDSTRPFIWVIQPGSGLPKSHVGDQTDLLGSDHKEEVYFPRAMDDKVGDRGLIIKGWAPQLLILSHPSTGGFLSHCGWNSTVEAIGRGVPILAWPIRGDQIYNGKLVVNHFKVGFMALAGEDSSEVVKKECILLGIEKLMNDVDVHKRSLALRAIFDGGFPTSSETALDDFREFISQKTV